MASNKTFLLMPSGSIAKQPVWARLKKDNPAAWELKNYDNGAFAIKLTAFDRIHTNGSAPPEHWMRFKVETFVIVKEDFEGNPLPLPKYVEDIDATKKYRTLAEAQTAYETFLARYTESAYNSETGRFEEKGNKLLPPDPDRPTVVESSPKAAPEDFGSW